MAARGQENYAMRQPPRVAPSGRKASLSAYHACARSHNCAKGKKKRTRTGSARRAKERSNIVPINLQRFKQKARARRPQQARSDSTGRFTIRPTSRVVGRRLGSRPGMTPLQTRPGMTPLQTRPGMIPLPTFPARRR